MFTKAELFGILQALQSVEDATVIPVKSGSGVCSRAYVVKGLNRLIDNQGDRITFSEVAKILDVDDKYISAIASTLPQDEWAVNGREIVPKQPFAILEDNLRSHLAAGVVTVITYMREQDITLEFLKKLVGYVEREWDVTVHWLDGERYIYSQRFFDGVIAEIKDEIADLERPVEFEEISVMKRGGWPVEFGQKVLAGVGKGGDLGGTWTESTFVPTVYKTRRQDEVVEVLKRDGAVEAKTAKRGYIDRPDEFLTEKVGEVLLLKEHYVTKDWLETIEKAAEKEAEERGVVDFRELASKLTSEERLHVQERFRKKQARKLLEHGGCLVTKELVEELLRIAIGHAKEEAEKAWAGTEKGRPMILSSGPSWRSLSTFLGRDCEVPQTALDSIAQSILSKVSTKYADQIGELRGTANAAAKVYFVDKIYLRYVVNSAAIEKIKDAGVQEKLAQDLLVYYQKIIGEGLTKLRDRVVDTQGERMNERIEDAISGIKNVFAADDIKPITGLRVIQQELESLMKNMGLNRPTEEAVEAKTAEMRRELKTQLDKTSDLSLMLLVVLILLFSEHEGGILRATGKYAPRILKQLKHRLAETDYEFLNSMKGVVIAKSSVDDEDVERLRSVGTSSHGTP